MEDTNSNNKNINITYETIFEILRREKTREDLQKLDDSFYNDVIEYIKKKKTLLKGSAQEDNIFASEEIRKSSVIVDNSKRLIKELYERRENKIIDLALNKSRTGSSIIDTTSLLDEEKELFNSLVELLNSLRNSFLYKVVYAQSGDPIKKETIDHSRDYTDDDVEPPKKNTSTEVKNADQKTEEAKVEIIKSMPKFVFIDGKSYGPFNEKDIVSLPIKLTEFLVTKERAKKA